MTTKTKTGETKRRGRGFGAMAPERRQELASKGGKAAHANGTAHEWGIDEARVAGRKGAAASHATMRARRAAHAARLLEPGPSPTPEAAGTGGP